MQLQLITLAVMAAAANAQAPASVESYISVLSTALPSSLFAEASTNHGALSSIINSDLSASSTPSWFSALPSDVKTFLVPTLTDSSSTTSDSSSSSITSSGVLSTTSESTVITGSSSTTAAIARSSSATKESSAKASAVRSSITGGHITATSTPTVTGLTTSTTGTGSSVSEIAATFPSSSSGGAAMPTAAMGMGVAGVAGLFGVLAL